MLFSVICCLILLVISQAVYRSEEEDRYYYPEFKFRAKAAHNSSRYDHIQQTLVSSAGVYKDKSRGEALGISNTVFMTVISYGKHRHYKLFLNNMLCYAQHYGIDPVVYIVHSHLQDPEKEIQEYNDIGIKAVSYPDELFWTLLYSKRTEIRKGPGRGDYESKVPSFNSHGALVMLVPVLEVMLHGFNAIFFDVDIAMVSDPIPYLIRGNSDFVSSLEMRHCPDTYTPTYPSFTQHTSNIQYNNTTNTTSTTIHLTNSALNMLNTNWYTIEPNTGIMYVRSTDASIGFYTNWLLNIIKNNEMNDQKALLRDKYMTKHSFDCLFGQDQFDMKEIIIDNSTRKLYISQQYTQNKFNNHINNNHHNKKYNKKYNNKQIWVKNYTTLIDDIQSLRYPYPIKFCFLSELLFQNGQTAFACGTKPSYKDSYILEMYQKGLHQYNENNLLTTSINNDNNNMNSNNNNDSGERYIITLHANFCDRKTHELAVRGLWLVQYDTPDTPYNNHSYCRNYEPSKTIYAMKNWTGEYWEVNNKRDYMYKTFVQPGKLIQSTTGKEVYLVNDQKMKQLIPDGDTFIATMGDNAWGDVRYLPQAIMDMVPFGTDIPSVKNTVLPTIPPTDATTDTTDTALSTVSSTTTLSTTDKTSNLNTHSTTPTTTTTPPPPPTAPLTNAHSTTLPHQRIHTQLLPGMLVRSQSSATIFFIDRQHKKRRVQNMIVFTRLFGAKRTKDVIIVPDSVLNSIHAGEPLVL